MVSQLSRRGFFKLLGAAALSPLAKHLPVDTTRIIKREWTNWKWYGGYGVLNENAMVSGERVMVKSVDGPMITVVGADDNVLEGYGRYDGFTTKAS